ncbi:MAG: right-handed parallel beta-helix repeat-containing protein [Verrucomicrobia bacterium]|nr:right-handed parallel beta-helix repeat-containing protein [Verrucomicrobiota bacterium]
MKRQFMTPGLSSAAFSFLRPALLAVALLAAGLSHASAQPYTTYNYTIALGTSAVDGTTIGAQPGWVIGIEAGSRTQRIRLANFAGTAANPIIFVNKGGKVRVADTTNGQAIKLVNCSHVILRGDNDPSYTYGIEVHDTTGQGIEIGDQSTDFEVMHVEVHDVTFAGIMAKTDPDGTTHVGERGYFTQYNTLIHDNYIHNTAGEGLYIGNSFWSSLVNGVQPSNLVGTRIYNNWTQHTGREGIQVGSASSDCLVYNNIVQDSGNLNGQDQNGGIQLGEGTTGKCYNNIIDTVPGNGLILLGIGDRLIANNIITNIGSYAVFCDDRAGEITGSHVRILNNTILTYGLDAYLLYNQYTVNEFSNNLLTTPTSGHSLINTSGSGATYTAVTNVTGALASLGLVNTAPPDYHLTSGSPAVDAGTNFSSVGVTTDFDGTARPQGTAYDVGAYERVATVSTAIYTPSGWGQAGSSYCPATGAFNAQPTWDNTNHKPTGDDPVPHSDTGTYYSGRYWYIDFGANWAKVRLTGCWTRYRPYSGGSYGGFGAMFWSSTITTTSTGLTATGINFGTAQSLPGVSNQLWVQDVDDSSAPVTPQARYLIIATGTTATDRANEFAFTGYQVP